MKQIVRRACKTWLATAATIVAVGVQAQSPYGLWNFNSDLSATVGDSLQFADGDVQSASKFGTTTSFGISGISSNVASVMRFPANVNSSGYYMVTPSTPNGGNGMGSLVNNYTIIFDLFYPASSDATFRPLIQTDDGLGSSTGTPLEIAVYPNNGVGTSSGTAQGTVTAGVWNRVALVVNSDGGYVKKFINGEDVGQQTISGIDSSFALMASANILILGTANENAAGGFISSMGFWDSALNAGQIMALGAPDSAGIPQVLPPVPSYIASRYPGVGETNIPPQPAIDVELQNGDVTISPSSIALYLDEVALSATVASVDGGYSVTATPSALLSSLTPHDLTLVYEDNSAGKQTNTWSFTVQYYQSVTLPAPIYIETFDGVAEGEIPSGWTVTNNTVEINSGFDLTDPLSDSYMNFVVIGSNTLYSVAKFDHRRFNHPPIVLNGEIVDSLINTNVFWCDSDQRSGKQVFVGFTQDYDLTGKSNVFVAWKSSYEQNQDNIASVEYSVDQGVTWLPVIYYLDDQNQSADIIRTNGVIDITATLGTARSDQADGLAYSNFIGAVVSTNLIPYIAGRINDDTRDGKRIEVVRISKADNASTVRFRFGYAGTASWYWGIDDFGLYSINTPVITSQPGNQTIDENTTATFSVVATSSSPISYQWRFKSKNIVGATNATYSIESVSAANVGSYDVVVSNSDGPVTSSSAVLTIVTTPSITVSPVAQTLSSGATLTLAGQCRGGHPLGCFWLFNGTAIPGATSTNYTVENAQATNSGYYNLVVTNSYGAATSSVALVTVFAGDITNGLVAHLKFDNDYSDSTGNGATGSAVGEPTFEDGIVGKAVHLISALDLSTNNYVTLGYPDVLKFGTNNFSVAFWTKIYFLADDKPFVSCKNWNSGSNPGWVIAPESNGGMKWNFNDTATSGRRDSSTVGAALLDQSWHQVTVTFERAGYGRIYLDGVLIDTSNMAPSTGVAIGSLDTDDLGNSINFGQDGVGDYTDSGSAAADMLLDDVGFWNRLLTPQEIASIYVQGIAGKDLTTASGKAVVLPAGIAQSPVSEAVSVSGTASFSVVPSGTAPFTFSWYKNGALVSGANSSNLVFTAQTTDAGLYYAVVANSGGSATSSVARLLVYSGTITNDLVVHLKFDGDYADASGRGNNASAVGSPSFVSGKIGQAFQFSSAKDGTSFNYATLGAPADLQFGTNDFSVSFWINYSSSEDDPAFISNKDWNSSSNPGWGIFAQNSGSFKVNATGPNRGTDKFNTAFSSVVRDGSWHLINVSYWRGQSVLTYVDGVLISSLAFSTAGSLDTNLNVNIGQDGTGTYTDGNSAAITAQIDDVGIWKRVLTADEIRSIYTAGQSGTDLTLQSGGEVTTLELSYTRLSTNSIKLTWTADSSVKLQQATKVGADADWTDVSGTLGVGSATIQTTNANAFYRLVK